MASDDPVKQLGELTESFALGQLNCQLLRTADGSYSLRYSNPAHPLTEPMHSSKGAWSETLTIYEPALRMAIAETRAGLPLRIASIGLGLGYNEILSVGLWLQAGLSLHDLQLLSFESSHDLIEAFCAFFAGLKASEAAGVKQLFPVYDDICGRVSQHCAIDESVLKRSLESLINCHDLCFYGELNTAQLDGLDVGTSGSQCVLFDAFSPDSSPDLWAEDFLDLLIARLAGPSCVWVSYASRTVLKRALQRAHFRLEKRPGFAGKRESTLAIRRTD